MGLPIVVAVLALFPSCILALDDNNVYADPMQTSLSIQRRNTASNEILQSIHNKLQQHTETLEKLMTIVQRNEELTKSIKEQVNKKLEVPETPTKINVHRSNRRNNDENEEIPIVKFGKDIVRYGNLLKTVIMSDVTKDAETTVDDIKKTDSPHQFYDNALKHEEDVIQSDNIKQNHTESRSYNVVQNTEADEKYFDHRYASHEEFRSDNNGQSQWCDVAAHCKQSSDSSCGFDDLFGLARFNNICHMVQANCYWNFNFTLAPCS